METKIKILSVIMLVIVFATRVQSSYAADGSISLSPQGGTYSTGAVFSVTVVLDGGGTAFNAAKATITVPPSLSVQSVSIGTCGFAFVKTPTAQDPSFAGVILGSSATSCNAYTMNIRAVSAGSATIVISDASIKAYSGATELLGTVNSGQYTITGSQGGSTTTPTQAPIVNNGQNYYNVNYSLNSTSTSKSSNLSVVLDDGKQSKVSTTPVQKESDYVATFENVPEGVHTITTYDGDEELSELVVNIAGGNRDVNIGGSSQEKAFPIALAIVGVLIIVLSFGVLGFLVHKHFSKKGEKKTPPATA